MKIRKTILALALAAALTLPTALAAGLDDLFPAVNSYANANYTDVEAGSWYADAARVCYETGIMTGTDSGFSPSGTVTVGEAAALAARILAARKGETVPSLSGGHWAAPYTAYLKAADPSLADVLDKPDTIIARSGFFRLLYQAVDEDILTPINAISALPDSDSAQVLAFYNAGVLTGVDGYGTFNGSGTLTRAEAATMVARILRPSLRKTFTLQEKPAETKPAETKPAETKPEDPKPTYEQEVAATTAVKVNGYNVNFSQFVTWMDNQIYLIDYQLYKQTGKRLDWNTNYNLGMDLDTYFKQLTLNTVIQQVVEESMAKALGLTDIKQLPATLYANPTKEALTGYVQSADLLSAKHILVESESDAQMILDALAQRPTEANFDAIMEVYSTDPGSKAYPEGYLFTAGDMVSEFEAGTRALDIGSYSKTPVKSSFGYHIIWRTDPTVHPDLVEQYQDACYQVQLNTWLDEATVTVNEATLADIDARGCYEAWCKENGIS